MHNSLTIQVEHQDKSPQIVSGLKIELLYHISSKSSQQSGVILKSPLDVLTDGRKELASLATRAQLQYQAEATSSPEKQSTSL